jgi:hypothetical protein
MIVKKILYYWKEKMDGYISIDKRGLYKDDYYLSFTKTKDSENHVHLITNNFYYSNTSPNTSFELIPTVTLGYIIKKNNTHLEAVKIEETDDPYKIYLDMVKLYENFDMNYYNSN